MSDIQPRYFFYNLTYVSEHGDVPNSVSFPEGAILSENYLPELTANGYNFLGWYSTPTYDIGTEVTVGYTLPNSDLTIYAKWEALKSLKQSLTAIADEIRELSGTTGSMGLDAMATHVGNANDNVSTEADLIAQISSALENKAAGGSGGSIETCTVTITTSAHINQVNATIFVDDEIGVYYEHYDASNYPQVTTIQNVVCGSVVTFINLGYYLPGYNCSNAELLGYAVGSDAATAAFKIIATNNGTATISVFNDN